MGTVVCENESKNTRRIKNDCRVPRRAHYSKASFATSIGLPRQNSVSNFIKDDKITSFSYDANGNLLTKENAYKSEQYFYNSINRMAQSIVIDTIEKTHTSTQYGYDAFGRRNLVQDQGSSTMRTLYDGFSFDIVQEAEVFQGGDFTTSYMELGSIQYTQTLTGTSRYRYVGDDPKTVTLGDLTQESTRYTGSRATLYANGQAVATNRSASLYDNGRAYFGTDILGSVRSATDDYASLEDRYEYDIFGTPYEGDFTGGLNTGYTGKPYDTVTGLYNYGYRDYSPQQARFTTVDPIRDGNNWFSYVVNDPVNYVDLWGLCASDAKQRLDLATSGTQNPYEGIEPDISFSELSENNQNHILQLQPRIWIQTIEMLHNLQEEGIHVEIVSSFRSVEEQNELYQIGRDENLKPIAGEKRVTNAKGGQSNHNFGVAFDVEVYKDGWKKDWDFKGKAWQSVINEGITQGFESGSTWSSPYDPPHFEDTGGKTTKELYDEYLQGDN